MHTNAGRGRLDPFVFPSNTDLRFALLVATVLASALFAFNALFFALPGAAAADRAASLACQRLAPTLSPGLFTNPLADPSTFVAASDAFSACLRDASAGKAALMAGGVVLVVLAAIALYWSAPERRLRRERFVPLETQRMPQIGAELERLSREAGLAIAPRFVWAPLDGSLRALAFGRIGRHYVAVTGGLIARLLTDPEIARAILRHELAHLKNEDVDKTYLAVAIWQSFLALALVPLVATLPFTGLDPLGVGLRVFVLAALVYASRNAVLRTRESYADVRASLSPDGATALERALGDDTARPTWWKVPFRLHPTSGERRADLRETDRLFGMGFWEAVATGIAAGLAVPAVVSLALMLLRTDLAQLVAVFVVAPLAVGIVGLGVWRGSLVTQVRGRPAVSGVRLGLGLGLGFLVGQELSLPSVVDLPLAQPGPLGTAIFTVLRLVWALVLIAGVVIFVRWLEVVAHVWLDAVPSRRAARLASRGVLTVAAIVLAFWLSWATSYVIILEQVRPASSFEDVLNFVAILLAAVVTFPLFQGVAGLLAGAALWALPFAALGLGARPTEARLGWAFLGGGVARGQEALRELRPLEALRIGIGGTLVYAVVLLLWRLTRLQIPESTRRDPDAILAFFAGQVALAFLVLGVTVAIATRRRGEFGPVHGLLAAFVGGCGMSIVILALNLAFGGTIDPFFAWSVVAIVLNGGALISIPLTLAATALSGKPRP